MALPGLSAEDPILSIEAKEGSFLVLGMTGFEHLGQMFEYTVDLAGSLNLLGTAAADVDLHKLVGTRATLKMKVDDLERYFDGFVTRAKRGEMRGRYPSFTVTLRPWLWFATQRKNSKVFQSKSVQEIIDEVLGEYKDKIAWRLDQPGDYVALDYCVQHNETDFDFVSRLMEEVGIYYFFEHKDKEHTLVFTDATGKHEAMEENDTLTWRNTMAATPTVTRWYQQEEARAVKAVLSAYDYLDPSTDIEHEQAFEHEIAEPVGPMEWFEHPTPVVQNSASEESTPAATPIEKRAKVRIEELAGLFKTSTGLTNALDFTVGATFELEGSPADADGEYLVTSTVYRITFSDHVGIEELQLQRRTEGFRCEFMCQSADDAPTFRSPRTTPRPVIAGPQTATVVGGASDEIKTDKHGRIKIQFHWDRIGGDDDDSSCWVRVAMPWASGGYGMVSLPRVGDEVVVQFMDGDPDRPLVTGAVYNADNKPPWELPAQATVNGVKSRSSTGGDADTANELRFDDKKDSEYVWFQAQKNYYRIVKNDAFDWVQNNETVKVTMTREEVIGENWFMDITKDVMHHVGQDLHVNVEGDIFFTGGATWQVKLMKDFNVKLDSGDLGVNAKMGKVQVKAMNVVIEATAGITLKCGGSIVNLSPAGVDIVGGMVKINSGGGGGSASPAAPDEAKKEDTITPEQQTVYETNFDDPMPPPTI